ncbi:MAG: DUF4340 domain-containing protein [Candidatus Omnitrophica bacterium]|nr:DUF4340 domain-containing protein [Candidatus Omnitrophota bacterium]
MNRNITWSKIEKRTVGLAIVVAILLVVDIIHARSSKTVLDPNDKKIKAAKRRETYLAKNVGLIPSSFHNQIIQFSLEYPKTKERFQFAKEDGRWFMTFPIRFPALETMMNELTQFLETSTRVRSFPLSEAGDLNEFGLKDPELRICLNAKSISGSYCFILGSASLMEDTCYALAEGENEIFLIDIGLRNALQGKTKYALLQKQIFPFVHDRAISISFRNENQTIELQKLANEWRRQGAQTVSVSSEKVNAFLTALNQLYIREFVEGADWKNKAFGLDESQGSVLSIQFLGGKSETLVIGKQASALSGYYAKLQGWPNVFFLSKEKLDGILSLLRSLSA